ncbi:Protein of unknown function [Pyronema omphalodes CBS 100304]|uniref:Uncharacterized protein n=1 Tax=Pyronema omphalodes (strain CBS 100304) TaxID=1076935 RepID=U4KYN3_PYROM|nr:Protein of unknown function [Pyronema omphalodes CBS 100304]
MSEVSPTPSSPGIIQQTSSESSTIPRLTQADRDTITASLQRFEAATIRRGIPLRAVPDTEKESPLPKHPAPGEFHQIPDYHPFPMPAPPGPRDFLRPHIPKIFGFPTLPCNNRGAVLIIHFLSEATRDVDLTGKTTTANDWMSWQHLWLREMNILMETYRMVDASLKAHRVSLPVRGQVKWAEGFEATRRMNGRQMVDVRKVDWAFQKVFMTLSVSTFQAMGPVLEDVARQLLLEYWKS